MQNRCSREEIVYAGFWVRAAAYLIDTLLVFVALLIVRMMMAGVTMLLEGTPFCGNILFQYSLTDIVVYVCGVAYFILCTYYTNTTIGKRAMNLRVVSANQEEKLSFLTVIYRETIGRFLSGFIYGIGYIMIGIDKEKRGIHDSLCNTRVIYEKAVKIRPIFPPPMAPIYTVPPMQRPPQTPSPFVPQQRSEMKKEGNAENETTGL